MLCQRSFGCRAPDDSGHYCPASTDQVRAMGYPIHDCEPDASGHHCVTCGTLAERVDPDELTEALMAAHNARPVAGQASWLD